MNRWSFAASIPLIVTGAVIWLVAAALSFENWRRRERNRTTLMLEILRMLAVTMLCFTLFKPELVRQSNITQRPEVAILCDASGSMQTRDVSLDADTIMERQEWLARKRAEKFWAPLEKNAGVVVEDFSPVPAEDAKTDIEEGTDINEAMERVLQRDRRLKAVLLLSDGDWNLGKSPVSAATHFRAQNIPVFTLATGSEKALPDVVLQQVSAPSYGLLGEQISIPFKVQNHFGREIRTTVSLYNMNSEVAKKDVVLPPFALVQDSVMWSPQELGEFALALKVPVEKDESLENNNEQDFRISVRAEKLNVLVVETTPRWEYRFLRNALARDPGVDMQCVLLHPGMPAGEGRNYLDKFPDNKEALSKYDVVFLGDVGIGPKELTVENAEMLKGLVEQQGSGLVFLPGAAGKELTFIQSPLSDLLPVVFDTAKMKGISLPTESHLILTGAGKGHLLTMLAGDEDKNQNVWKNLPGFYWCAAVEKNRPGSEVLAVHSALRNAWGRMPLLVTRPYGNGKVLFMGTDGAWRWRRGVEDKYHYRFWGQVVRWMAHQRHLAQGVGIRLTFSPEDPRAGETVYLQSTVLDSSGYPLEKGSVTGTIRSPKGNQERLEFSPVAGGWGVFKTSFVPPAGGTYKIRIACEEAQRNLETDLVVSRPKREKLGQPANVAAMREIADITHGIAGGVQDLEKIIQQISVLPEPQPIEKRIRLWCNPWWGASILLIFVLYWTARKFAGMI